MAIACCLEYTSTVHPAIKLSLFSKEKFDMNDLKKSSWSNNAQIIWTTVQIIRKSKVAFVFFFFSFTHFPFSVRVPDLLFLPVMFVVFSSCFCFFLFLISLLAVDLVGPLCVVIFFILFRVLIFVYLFVLFES